MALTKQYLDRIRELLRSQEGFEPSENEVVDVAERLLSLVKTVYRPLPTKYNLNTENPNEKDTRE